MNEKPSDIAGHIADELAACGVKLVASLPDNWLTGVIDALDRDERFTHIPVNREESAIGLCSGAYMGAMGSAALMGASGFMTVIYAITKINYTYEIPLFLMLTLRGGVGDHHKHHASNSLYLRPVLDAIDMPYRIIDQPGDISSISRCYHHTRTFSRPMAVIFTRDLLRGGRHMKYLDCFRALARQRTDQIVVTSAGNSGQAWWAATRDTEATFYLDASMSLSTMFASGLAFARPELKIWAFMGDGAFCMNPGMLMVERQMNLPNLTHFLVSNRVYGATSNAGLPNVEQNDYAAIARAMGLDRVFEFADLVGARARPSDADGRQHGRPYLRGAGGRAVFRCRAEARAAALRRRRVEIPLRPPHRGAHRLRHLRLSAVS